MILFTAYLLCFIASLVDAKPARPTYTMPPTPKNLRNEIYLYATDFEARGGNLDNICEDTDPPIGNCRAHMSFLSYNTRRLTEIPYLYQFSPMSPVFGWSRLTESAEYMGSWSTVVYQQVTRLSLAEMGVLPPHTAYWTKYGCHNWSVAKRGVQGSVGYSSYRTSQWLSNGSMRCSTKLKWLCMCVVDIYPQLDAVPPVDREYEYAHANGSVVD